MQSAGARAVPIVYDAPREEIAAIVDRVNGLLLPGGGAPITPGHRFYDTVALLVNLTMAANDAGEYFPVRSSGITKWYSRVKQGCSCQQQSRLKGPEPVGAHASSVQQRFAGERVRAPNTLCVYYYFHIVELPGIAVMSWLLSRCCPCSCMARAWAWRRWSTSLLAASEC